MRGSSLPIAFLFGVMTWLLAGCSAASWLLNVPTPSPLPPLTPSPPVRAPSSSSIYIVKPGDTLWRIAKRTGVDVETLILLNQLENPNMLQPGQRLILSGQPLPTPAPTPILCSLGCATPPPGCRIKAYRARLDGMPLYVLPEDPIYPLPRAELWFCREEDAQAAGWVHWTPAGPAAP